LSVAAEVFVSYAREDLARVRPLAEALESQGLAVWWDAGLRAGVQFDEEIEQAIAAARCVLVVWTGAAARSQWVRAEAAEALDANKLIPVFLEPVKTPLRFRHVQGIDLAGWNGRPDHESFLHLLRDIRRLTGTGGPGQPNRDSGDSPRDPPASPDLGTPRVPRASPGASTGVAGNRPIPPAPIEGPKPIRDLSARGAPAQSRPTRWTVAWLGALVLAVLVAFAVERFVPAASTWLSIAGPRLDPPKVFRDTLKDGTPGPEMVALPGGTFNMGSPDSEPERSSDEGPVHEVRIRPFAIGRTELTFAEYDRFAQATGRGKPGDWGWGRGDRPVIEVSWKDATAYAEWLSQQSGQSYRLPTEAEWEYAARAGTETPFWTGGCIHWDQASFTGDRGYAGCGAKTGNDRRKTVPAGSLPANPWGLHEVAGSVREWVQDCWHEGYQGAPSDGRAWDDADGGDCARRVARGGGWSDHPARLRSASRGWTTAEEAYFYLGFRLARTL
jgi:formylglycine-generating enzyme required for sulfatase activity